MTTPLQCAAGGNHIKAMQLLIDNGANVNGNGNDIWLLSTVQQQKII